jgi:hypothetical protein
MKNLLLLILAFAFSLPVNGQGKSEYYELKIYTLNKAEQENRVDQYLADAYIPTLHKLGYKSVGVFKPIEQDTTIGIRIYVLVAYPSLENFATIQSQLNMVKDWQAKGKDYIDATIDNPAFTRIESILLRAFPLAPKMQTPNLKGPRKDRVYELRSYEGPSQKKYENKVKMFNDGDEIGIFKQLDFNAVFYGEVLAGSHMPNLMYMTTFENKQSRDEHWKAFSSDPQWDKLKVDPQYQKNVSKNVQLFLRPTEYSDY